MSETKTVGTIGQMYENRKTGKLGTLLEVNDKYKTLLMESPDGETFNISFASLKSNWRKAKESVVEETEQTESEPTESEPEAVEHPDVADDTPMYYDVANSTDDNLENPVNDNGTVSLHRTKKYIGRHRSNMFEEAEESMFNLAINLGRGNNYFSMVSMPHRKGFAFKFGKHRFMEIYVKPATASYQMFVKEEFFKECNFAELLHLNLSDITYRPDYYLNTYFKFPMALLSDALEKVEEVMSEKVKNNKNNKED